MRAAVLLDDYASHESGGFAFDILCFDGDDIWAGGEVFGDVVDIELLPVFAATDAPAVDVDLILVVSADLNLTLFWIGDIKGLAKVARSLRRELFFESGGPDPLDVVCRVGSRANARG